MLRAVAIRVALALALAPLTLACGHDHGTPQVRPAPTPDGQPLRGPGERKPRSPRIANYKIDAKLDVATHEITATATLTWTNSGKSPVRELPFHLYLNAFKNDASLFMRTSRGQARGVGHVGEWGFIHIDSLQIAGAELAQNLVFDKPDPKEGIADETVATLPLATPVEQDQTIEVAFKFTAKLPEVFARTGYKGEFHMVAQWFPKIGVRVGPEGSEHWECRPFHATTEFFADFGTYDVRLTVPNTYVVAATGVLAEVSPEAPNGTRTLTYRAEDVHDFVWMADPYMEVMSGQAKVDGDPVEVRVVYRPEQQEFARRHLDAAIGAVEQFSKLFLPYPWPILTVVDPPVDAAFAAGGMEYPTLVTTLGDTVFARPGMRLPEYVTIHEVGHNWFQGMLASNEPVEAWLDEGVNEWADVKVMDNLYGAHSAIDWLGWQAEIGALRRALADDPASLPSPIATAGYAFVDESNYGEATYTSTMRALRTLEAIVKPTVFAAAMQGYVKEWAFKHPTGRNLFESLHAQLHMDLEWFFGPVFHDVGGVKLGRRSAGCRPAHPPRGWLADGSGHTRLVTEIEAPDTGSFDCEVVVENTGTVLVPVEVEARFADGSSRLLADPAWDDHATNWHRFRFQTSSELVEVRIDPDNKIWLDSPMTHAYRIESNGDAAMRAGAWIGTTTQTLMQVLGP